MAISHLVARVARRDVDLREWGLAGRVWRSLRRAFPEGLAATLMPDHVHLVDESVPRDEGRRRLARALSRATYGLGRGVWDAAPEPDVVHESKLARTIRYVALNPCRAGLVADPLEWMWSTYREVMGAVVDPWVDGSRLAERLGHRRWGSSDEWHRYVSSDFAVTAGGTSPPGGGPAGEAVGHALGDIARAVAACLRVSPACIGQRGPARRLFIGLARRQRWRDTALLASVVETTQRSVERHLLAEIPGDDLRAASLCLADERLRRMVPSSLDRRLGRRLRGDARACPGERREIRRLAWDGPVAGALHSG